MPTMNKAILIGKLTNNVQLRETSSGLTVANFNFEITESYVNKTGERQETTTQVDIEVWGVQAENCAKYLSKGREVLVEGRLKLDQWNDQEGKNCSRLLVRAKNVKFLDAPPLKVKESMQKTQESPPPAKKPKIEPDYPPEWDDIEVPPFG